MAYSANVFEVLIASPGDVPQERQAIPNVIHAWNALNSKHDKIALMPVMWETHSTPELGDRPQGIINRQVVDDCDMLIAVFGSRLGTPTGKYASGTMEEIEKFRKAGKPVMVYFSKQIDATKLDIEQYQKLRTYQDELKQAGLVGDFNNLDELVERLRVDLERTVRDKFKGASAVEKKPEPELDESAIKMLIDTAKVPNGEIAVMFGGRHIQAGKENPASRDSTQEVQAQWRNAVNELEDAGLIEARNSERTFFDVTDKGFKFYKSLLKAGSQISDDAERMLLLATEGLGQITKSSMGLFISAGRETLVSDAPSSTPEERAKWEHIIKELIAKDLIEPRNQDGTVFKVTHTGYELAKKLKPKT